MIPVVVLENATVARKGRAVFSGLDWTVREGETWAVAGPTGSGKTTLAETLLGRQPLSRGHLRWPLIDRLRSAGQRIDYPSQAIVHVTFKEESRLFSYAGHYYQQRYEFADEDEPLSLGRFLQTRSSTPAEVSRVATRLGIAAQLPQPFMTLSNGQTRRARLARALLFDPVLLILDDPFIGLDSQGRTDLSDLLAGLVGEGKRIVLICREDAIPAWVTHVLHSSPRPSTWADISGPSGRAVLRPERPLASAQAEGLGGISCREDAIPAWVTHVLHSSPRPSAWADISGPSGRAVLRPERPLMSAQAEGPGGISEGPGGKTEGVGEKVIELADVSVRHGGKTILDSVSWTVRAGERWAVVGSNGSGKTTLLSLLCGDHPQAYSNDVRLFGRRRGTGETIWDVKRNVGLLSPEFHLYFTEPLSAERTVATGFFDTLANRPTTPEQTARVHELFADFGISPLLGRPFHTLSTGEQRLVLLLRALVKRPPLLILDEPFQGLDVELLDRCREWVARELAADQTLLFVTHDLAELPRGVDAMLSLNAGRAAEARLPRPSI